MTFSDYIIYVDESGDHSLTSIDTGYPIFVLSFCIFKKSEYVNSVVPRIQHFKFRWFGHDLVILHEHEIVKKQPPFGFLQFDDIRSRFMTELTEIINASPMTVIAAVIRKTPFETSNVAAGNPYAVALLSCLERTRLFLQTQSAKAGTVHIVCEARSARKKGGKMGREDEELEQEFRRIVAGRHGLQSRTGSEAMPEFEIVFAPKQANSSGLQLADLTARPIGLSVLRPDQPNRAFEILQKKLWAGGGGSLPNQGLHIIA